MSFEQLADLEWVCNVGRGSPECEWILSDRDAWYRNPWYSGPKGRHPEDDYSGDEELAPAGEWDLDKPASVTFYNPAFPAEDDWEDIPF